jgi:hypothetical protein
MGYIDHRRLIHSEAKKIGENHFALCSGHHVLIAPLSHANLSRSEHENLGTGNHCRAGKRDRDDRRLV